MQWQGSSVYEILIHWEPWLCKEKNEILKLVWISQISQNYAKIKGLMALVHKKWKACRKLK